MPDELHKRISELADEHGISTNTAINLAIEKYLQDDRIDLLEQRIKEIERQLAEK
jgi:predicted DNA-binding protein